MNIRRSLLMLFASIANASFACDNTVEKVYASAGLKVFPEVVSEEIDENEIARKRRDREGYYVQRVCDSGKVMMLTKYIGKNMYFKIEYIYKSDRLVGKRTTQSNGKVIEYFSK